MRMVCMACSPGRSCPFRAGRIKMPAVTAPTTIPSRADSLNPPRPSRTIVASKIKYRASRASHRLASGMSRRYASTTRSKNSTTPITLPPRSPSQAGAASAPRSPIQIDTSATRKTSMTPPHPGAYQLELIEDGNHHWQSTGPPKFQEFADVPAGPPAHKSGQTTRPDRVGFRRWGIRSCSRPGLDISGSSRLARVLQTRRHRGALSP